MDIKKGVSLSCVVLLILSVPFILYLGNFKLIAFDEQFYEKEFSKYGIYDDFSEDVDAINSKLLYYLRYDKTDEYVEIDMFDEKEKDHLLDVKNVIQKVLVFLNFVFVCSTSAPVRIILS